MRYILVQLIVLAFAGIPAAYLFYVQHSFPGTYWRRHAEWDYMEASLAGSSRLVLPRFLQWVTGNIGFHHIHHLAPRIPNYRLPEAQDCLSRAAGGPHPDAGDEPRGPADKALGRSGGMLRHVRGGRFLKLEAKSGGRIIAGLGVRAHEVGRLRAVMVSSFLLGVSLVFYYSASNAIFLTRYGVQKLPYVYIVNGFLVIAFGVGLAFLGRHVNVPDADAYGQLRLGRHHLVLVGRSQDEREPRRHLRDDGVVPAALYLHDARTVGTRVPFVRHTPG